MVTPPLRDVVAAMPEVIKGETTTSAFAESALDERYFGHEQVTVIERVRGRSSARIGWPLCSLCPYWMIQVDPGSAPI